MKMLSAVAVLAALVAHAPRGVESAPVRAAILRQRQAGDEPVMPLHLDLEPNWSTATPAPQPTVTNDASVEQSPSGPVETPQVSQPATTTGAYYVQVQQPTGMVSDTSMPTVVVTSNEDMEPIARPAAIPMYDLPQLQDSYTTSTTTPTPTSTTPSASAAGSSNQQPQGVSGAWGAAVASAEQTEEQDGNMPQQGSVGATSTGGATPPAGNYAVSSPYYSSFSSGSPSTSTSGMTGSTTDYSGASFGVGTNSFGTTGSDSSPSPYGSLSDSATYGGGSSSEWPWGSGSSSSSSSTGFGGDTTSSSDGGDLAFSGFGDGSNSGAGNGETGSSSVESQTGFQPITVSGDNDNVEADREDDLLQESGDDSQMPQNLPTPQLQDPNSLSAPANSSPTGSYPGMGAPGATGTAQGPTNNNGLGVVTN